MIVYQATNNLNGKVYIGKTKSSLRQRSLEHRRSAVKGSRMFFHSAIKKHGFDAFRFEPLAWCATDEHLNFLEKLYISLKNSKVPNGYNLTDGGDGMTPGTVSPMKGKTRSKEFKEKMSIALMGNQHLLGHKHTAESKAKIGRSLLGRKRGRYANKVNFSRAQTMRRWLNKLG